MVTNLVIVVALELFVVVLFTLLLLRGESAQLPQTLRWNAIDSTILRNTCGSNIAGRDCCSHGGWQFRKAKTTHLHRLIVGTTYILTWTLVFSCFLLLGWLWAFLLLIGGWLLLSWGLLSWVATGRTVLSWVASWPLSRIFILVVLFQTAVISSRVATAPRTRTTTLWRGASLSIISGWRVRWTLRLIRLGLDSTSEESSLIRNPHSLEYFSKTLNLIPISMEEPIFTVESHFACC